MRGPQGRRKHQRVGTLHHADRSPRRRRPDHVWALDLSVRRHRERGILKLLHVVDEFTRGSLSDRVAHSIDADATVVPGLHCSGANLRPLRQRFARSSDNALWNWCRFGGAGTS